MIHEVTPLSNHLEELRDGPERERREEAQRADEQDHEDQQPDEEGVVGGQVPALSATFFLPAREPAIASVAMSGTNRTKSITRPIETFRKGVFALKPAKAEPLFPPADE